MVLVVTSGIVATVSDTNWSRIRKKNPAEPSCPEGSAESAASLAVHAYYRSVSKRILVGEALLTV